MATPPTTDRVLQKYQGSPRVASSKKSLFGKPERDESDIGPVTPLRFGKNRQNTTKTIDNALNNITSFRNLFGNDSPGSDRSLSPDYARRYTNNGRYELISDDYEKENLSHGVDEETRFSFTSIPETPSSRLSAENALQDENNSNSLSLLMNSDLNLFEKRCKTFNRTPGVTTRSHSGNIYHNRSTGSMLRRTQRHEEATDTTMDTRSPSPDDADKAASNVIPKRSKPKARTVLDFNDIQPISAKSFYSSTTNTTDKPLVNLQSISTKSFYSTSLVEDPKTKSHSASKDSSSKTISNYVSSTTNSSHNSSKTPRKGTMRQRTKSFSNNAPRLGQRGAVHKIRKPSKNHSSGKTKKEKSSPRGFHIQTKNRAIAGGTKSCPTTPKSADAHDPDHDHLLEQFNRVSSILLRGQNNLKRSFAMSRSMTDLTRDSMCDDIASSGSENDESESEAEDESGTNKRKFFRSRKASRSNLKVYNHFDTIKIGVRSGRKRKLLKFPEQPKRRRTDLIANDFDFETEQLEVEHLISTLDKSTETEQFQFAQHRDEDDAPIPIQSNTIYLTVDEYLVADPHTSESMDCEAPGISENIRQSHDGNDSNGYYPIFYRDRLKEIWKEESQQACLPERAEVFQLLRQQETRTNGRNSKSDAQKHQGIGKDQYQIDAGQRAFGAIQCNECGLTYSTNEPEEELFHDQFHRSLAKMTFPSWANEQVVAQVPEWDVTGRIIVLSQVDSNRHWLKKIHPVLEVVDSELGYATQGQIPEGACVYIAIARSTVLGVAVVQPLQYANRMICLEGLHGVAIDCYSSEFYTAKCGISRIWVAPKYRRRGIGRKIMAAIRRHYIFGYAMKYEEIAFGAPTEVGKLFAEAITERKDFLVYV